MELIKNVSPGLLVGTIAFVAVATVAGVLSSRSRRHQKQPNHKTFVVTGAGSGLGRSVSRILCRNYNVKLILVDRNKDAIEFLSVELGTDFAIPFCCDLSRAVDIEKLSEWVKTNHADVSGLLHFAGLTHGKKFLEANISEINTILMVNFVAVVKLTRLLLPTLLANPRPIVLAVSSVSGLIGVAGLVDYSATKHGVTGFCESLRKELREDYPEACVCCVHPYVINTGMFAGVRGSCIRELDQEYVSARIVGAIRKREEDLVIPAYLWLIILVTKIVPLRLTVLIEKLMGTNKFMHGYCGRQKQ